MSSGYNENRKLTMAQIRKDQADIYHKAGAGQRTIDGRGRTVRTEFVLCKNRPGWYLVKKVK